jgi:hypothetical protein
VMDLVFCVLTSTYYIVLEDGVGQSDEFVLGVGVLACCP